MLIGGHFPISGGLNRSINYIVEAKGNSLQIFTKSPGQWKAREISDEEADSFKKLAQEKEINHIIVHDSYLINLATDDKKLRDKSLKAFIDEIKRAHLIGAGYLVTHMGAHKGKGEEMGLELLAEAVTESIRETESMDVMILLETTAGQGTQLGYRFEHLAEVIEKCGGHGRIGVCLDTCHVFAAGYDLSTKEGYDLTFREFERIIGLERLKVIHMNDAKKHLGSRVDRHAHIGEGFIGLEGFGRIVNDPRFKNVPLILETPQPEKMHKVHIKTLTSLVKS